MKPYSPKPRTSQQNRSLWLYLTLKAEQLNLAGLDMRVVLKPTYSIPWTKQSAHDHLWIPIQKAMFSKDSTTKLDKLQEIEKIHEVIERELGEKHGLDFLPWPNQEEGEVVMRNRNG